MISSSFKQKNYENNEQMIRILQIRQPQEIKQIMRDIRVDSYGIKIMLPKALPYLAQIEGLTCIAANILKQEMLSLGGDAAVARGALTGKSKKTGCLLMGNLAVLQRLNCKLSRQPFGLNKLADDLSRALDNYQRENFALELGSYKLNLGKRTRIMGIVNLTPDSFSGDGLYQGTGRRAQGTGGSLDYCQQMVDEGVDIIDIGGESSRPGAKQVSLKEELARTIPLIREASKKIKVPISIDTSKPEVAAQALDSGAVIVNDTTGLRNLKMAKLVAKYKAGIVIMHMQGSPRTMQKNPHYQNLIGEITEFLAQGINRAQQAGVQKEKIIIDPGIGFGKSTGHNLEILKNLSNFKVLGRPILVGASRKSFIGEVLKVGAKERIFGTVASCVLAAQNGAGIVRVHDVLAIKQALKVCEAVNK